jgi:signal peptidase I
MASNIWTAWKNQRLWRRARDEGKRLVKEARRILRRRGSRLPQSVTTEVEACVGAVESAMQSGDFDKLRESMAALDAGMDHHLAFARKSTAREYAESIGVALAVALLLRAFVVEAFQIPSGSMIPTLEIGDHIFVSKFSYGIGVPFSNKQIVEFGDPKRGDVIVFRYPPDPSIDFIKRVVALPGETVELRRNQILINGRPMPRERVAGPCHYAEGRNPEEARECEGWIEQLDGASHQTYQDPNQIPQDWGPMVVPARNVFVMGDNRDNSRDSRVWGFVPFANIKGRALIVWWSRDPAYGGLSPSGVAEWFKSIRGSRFFHVVK